MLRKILRGYGRLFVSIAKIILLLITCALLGSILVLPLWKFAIESPQIYSIVVGIALFIFICYVLIKRIKKYIFQGTPDSKEKKDRIKKLIINFFKFFIWIIGIALAIYFVLIGMSFLSLIVIIIASIIFGILAFGTRKT